MPGGGINPFGEGPKTTEGIISTATAGPNVDAVLAEFAITAAGRVRTNHRINFVAIGGR
jgi:hypothetical protein